MHQVLLLVGSFAHGFLLRFENRYVAMVNHALLGMHQTVARDSVAKGARDLYFNLF